MATVAIVMIRLRLNNCCAKFQVEIIYCSRYWVGIQQTASPFSVMKCQKNPGQVRLRQSFLLITLKVSYSIIEHIIAQQCFDNVRFFIYCCNFVTFSRLFVLMKKYMILMHFSLIVTPFKIKRKEKVQRINFRCIRNHRITAARCFDFYFVQGQLLFFDEKMVNIKAEHNKTLTTVTDLTSRDFDTLKFGYTVLA